MFAADANQLIDQLKYWGPIITFFVLITRAYFTVKKNIGTWAEKLLTNHLAHIESSTTRTVEETERTNALLKEQATKADLVALALKEQSVQQMQVWGTVTKTLIILEDRSRRPVARSTRKKK